MATELPRLPGGLELVRTTDEWDEHSLPEALLRTHRIADAVWGRLVVRAGSIELTFEDDDAVLRLGPGDAAAIPPGRPHHVTIDGPVRFAVEFHRRTTGETLGSTP